jgi:hypothetical protein
MRQKIIFGQLALWRYNMQKYKVVATFISKDTIIKDVEAANKTLAIGLVASDISKKD